MKRFAAVLVGALLGAVVAVAAPDVDPWENVATQKRFMRPAAFEQEVRFTFLDGGDISVNAATATTLTVGALSFTPRGRGVLVYDFPTLGGVGQQLNSTICADSPAADAGGCRFGDGTLLGIDQDYPSAFGTITARMTGVNEWKVQACANGISDGGSFNMPDASYTFTCVR